MPEETKRQISNLMDFYKYEFIEGIDSLKEWE
jgi:hypothetical protein